MPLTETDIEKPFKFMSDALDKLDIPDSVFIQWQETVELLAELIHIPSALIMRVVGADINVFLASRHKDSPYKPGDSERLDNSGLYCETVIKTGKKLLVPNALEDCDWNNNPDIKLGMISYLGFPLLWPNGKPFGTICILDNKENGYSKTVENLMNKFQGIVASQLELIYMNATLGVENRKLFDYLEEIKTLRRIVPICSSCKKIRDDRGYWSSVEEYFEQMTDINFSHGYCPECAEDFNKDVDAYIKKRHGC